MQTRCPHCNQTFKVPDDYLGRRCRCAECRKPFIAAESGVSHISAGIEQDQNTSKSPVTAIIITALIAAALAVAAGFAAGMLTTRPKRAELESKVSASIEASRKELITEYQAKKNKLTAEYEALKTEAQEMIKGLTSDTEYLLEGIRVAGYLGRYDCILSLRRETANVAVQTKKYNEIESTIMFILKEIDKLQETILTSPESDNTILNQIRNSLLLAIESEKQFQRSFVLCVNNPDNRSLQKTFSEHLILADKNNKKAFLGVFVLYEKIMPGLTEKLYPTKSDKDPKSGT